MIEDTTNFLPLSEDLWSAGMPTADQIRDAARRGVQVIINLAMARSNRALKGEAALVRSLGVEYANVPVVWDAPTTHDLQRFFELMDRHAGRKILVHCQANYRATAFIALYRVRRLGWEPAAALEDLRRVWNPDEYPVWKEFIAQNLNPPKADRS
jgi:protein tyrosine phosphatase (PTP) superfamily phosphohydrolase (DUF442 family)